MEKSYKGYIYKLGLLSLVMLLIGGIGFSTFLKSYFIWVYPFIVVYFFLLNVLQHFFLLSSSVNNPRVFQTNYMMWFGVKLFLNLTFVLIYILVDKPHALMFVLVFGLCYICYSIFEVAVLSKILRRPNVK